jgi:hypothetical protein
MADYIENIDMYMSMQLHCPRWTALQLWFGEGNLLPCQLKDYELYFQQMTLMTQGDEMERLDARHYLEDPAAGTLEGVF